jgi:hypothetical protein
MITNTTELEWALQQIEGFEAALDALREEIAASNPALFAVTSRGYERRIRALREDVVAFLRDRPTEAPLYVSARGARVGQGIMPARLAAQLLDGLQTTLLAIGRRFREEDRLPKTTRLRDVMGLNVVATASGSFVFALDLAPRAQRVLMRDYDLGEQALAEMISYINSLTTTAPARGVPRAVLLGLRKIADLVPSDVREIELKYVGPERTLTAALSETASQVILSRLGEGDLGPQTVKGVMVGIDVEQKKCTVHSDEGLRIGCDYDESLEDSLIRSIKHRVEIAGLTEPVERPRGGFRITRIERFRRLPQRTETDADEETEE